MELTSLYDSIEKLGVMTFSTILNDEVHSRSAHFNGFDEDGLYFRTMANKPYARQLRKTGYSHQLYQRGWHPSPRSAFYRITHRR